METIILTATEKIFGTITNRKEMIICITLPKHIFERFNILFLYTILLFMRKLLNKLRCPIYRSELHANDIPFLANETTSRFSAQDIDPALKTVKSLRQRIREFLDKTLPEIDINLGTRSNDRKTWNLRCCDRLLLSGT